MYNVVICLKDGSWVFHHDRIKDVLFIAKNLNKKVKTMTRAEAELIRQLYIFGSARNWNLNQPLADVWIVSKNALDELTRDFYYNI